MKLRWPIWRDLALNPCERSLSCIITLLEIMRFSPKFPNYIILYFTKNRVTRAKTLSFQVHDYPIQTSH